MYPQKFGNHIEIHQNLDLRTGREQGFLDTPTGRD